MAGEHLPEPRPPAHLIRSRCQAGDQELLGWASGARQLLRAVARRKKPGRLWTDASTPFRCGQQHRFIYPKTKLAWHRESSPRAFSHT